MSMVPVASTGSATGVFFQSASSVRHHHHYNNQMFPGDVKFLQSPSPSIANTSRPAVSASGTIHEHRQAASITSGGPLNGHVAPSTRATNIDQEDEQRRLGLNDYFQQSAELVATTSGGPPRWFSPLECCSKLKDSPLLLFLPGVDGTGLGFISQHQRVSKFFDIWCLHIPLTDRTPFTELVKLVESTVRIEHSRAPDRPIYLVGETFGACIALAVSARNPNIDLILILANPATSFRKSSVVLQQQSLMPLLTMVPQQLFSGLPHMLLLGALPVMAVFKTVKGLPFQQVIEELSGDSLALSSYLSAISNVLTAETLEWKLNILKSAAAFVNSRVHNVRAQTLVLASGQDTLFTSKEEGERLKQLLPKCKIRVYDGNTDALFLQDGINLVSILNGTSFYRRRRSHDYVLDYLPQIPSELRTLYDTFRWIDNVTDPVMLSTLESGKIVRSLDGIPREGPVLFVGYHMMMGLEIYPLVNRLLTERKVLLRGMAHPLMFYETFKGQFPAVSDFDTFRNFGAVPVSPSNFYRLFTSKSHILLYPGGVREALHRKGEEYKLFWPEQSEFIKMAARFGATIIPFGSVGEDDIGQLVGDYDDLRKIPFINTIMEEITEKAVKLRSDAVGEVANQHLHVPVVLPKIPPGRFYYYFGKPIHLQGKKQELKTSEETQVMYLQVKQEVENCLAYLKEKRENDPYRNIIARLAYKAMHGSIDTEIPTFDF